MVKQTDKIINYLYFNISHFGFKDCSGKNIVPNKNLYS